MVRTENPLFDPPPEVKLDAIAMRANQLRMHWRANGNRREIADLDRLHHMWIEQAGDDAGEAQRAALRDHGGPAPRQPLL